MSIATPVQESTPARESPPPARPRRPRSVTPEPASGVLLPHPPTDTERDRYLHHQQRWVPVASVAGSALIAVSLWFLMTGPGWGWMFAILLVLTTVSTSLTLLTSTRRRRVTLQSHRALVESWHPDRVPSVDVFLPTAGESLEVLANTYLHVAELSWAGELVVYVLDDSARPEVEELARSHGFRYLTRPDRGHLKKAGNLRFGFDRSHGDLITILDADFVPRVDYLLELVPYLDDPAVAIVQSPQYFDLDKRMNWVQLSAGATQVLFYRWTQPSWDRSGASICVGTCAVYRRSALAAVGGFPQIGHSEDVYTGVALMSHGHQLRYVPTLVSKGICPDTLDAFVAQQYRWCTGSLSLMLSGRFHRMSLTPWQRLSFWAGFTYYLDTALNVFLTALPPILLALLTPSLVDPANYLFVLLALTMRAALVPLISDGRDTVIGLARIQTAYSIAHAVALVDVLRRRTDTWQATGSAGGSSSAVRIRRVTVIWLLATQIASWTLIGWRTPEFGGWQFVLMAAFSAMQLVTVYPLIAGRAEFRRGDPMSWRRRLPGYLAS